MHELVSRIGFHKSSHFVSDTDYPRCLARAWRDILAENLAKNPDDPLLVLEDDVEWNGQTEIHVTYGTDAVWLGFSTQRASLHRNAHDGNCIVLPWNQYMMRVWNMLTTHAVLFLSRRYKESVLRMMEAELVAVVPTHIDVLLARQQHRFQVLAPRGLPFFYQSSKFNPDWVEAATQFTLGVDV